MILKAFETFNEFVEIKKVLTPHLPLLIDAALKISLQTEYGLNLREVTMLFLEQIGENYSRYLVKKAGTAIIDKIIEAAFMIASETEDDFEEGQDTPHQLALYLIFSYSSSITIQIMYPIIMKYVQKFGSSTNPLERKAAVKVLGFISDPDSCLDMIKENIDDATSFIVQKLQDQSVSSQLMFHILQFIVREAAAETVGKFSEYVVPEFLDEHQLVMPCLLRVLKELTPANDLTL